MKKSALAILATGVLVAGCGGSSPTAEEREFSPSAPTSEATPPTTMSSEDAFTKVMRDRGIDPQSAEKLAKSMCGALDRGASVNAVARTALGELSPDVAGPILGAGVPAFCPEHEDKVSQWSATQ